MPKVKDIKTKKSRKTKITVKSLMNDVRKKINEKKVKKVMSFLESRQLELDNAEIVVKKLKNQIDKILNMDINEIDLDDFEDFENEDYY